MIRRRHTALVLALVVSLGWSAVAGCTDSVQAKAPEMACCLHGHHDCKHAAPSMACCNTSASNATDQQATVVKATRSAQVPLVAVDHFVDPIPAPSAVRSLRRLDPAPIRPPDIPTYLIDSVFLL